MKCSIGWILNLNLKSNREIIGFRAIGNCAVSNKVLGRLEIAPTETKSAKADWEKKYNYCLCGK